MLPLVGWLRGGTGRNLRLLWSSAGGAPSNTTQPLLLLLLHRLLRSLSEFPVSRCYFLFVWVPTLDLGLGLGLTPNFQIWVQNLALQLLVLNLASSARWFKVV